MTQDFQWFDDSGYFKIPLPRVPGHPRYPLTIHDGYSQWNLVRGLEFDLANEIEKEHEDDFRFVSAIKSLAGTGIRGAEFEFRGHPLDLISIQRVKDGSDSPTELVTHLPLRRRSVPDGTKSPTAKAYQPNEPVEPEKMVIVGIIDDGINVAHERFRSATGKSRVDFAWIQDADTCANPTVEFGREWTAAEIDAAVAVHGDDEDACMKALQFVGDPSDPYRPSPLRLRASHGTFVADLAAGYDPGDADVNRRLITVQLPALASQDTSGSALIASVLAAAQYIYQRALAISEHHKVPIPVVLNFSYGLYGGPRNGLHVLERALRAMALKYQVDLLDNSRDPWRTGAPFELVLPAGNQHLTRTHAAMEPAARGAEEQTLDVAVRICPDDRTSSFVEFWFPKEAIIADQKSVKLEIAVPGHVSKHEIVFDLAKPGQAEVLACVDGAEPFDPNTVIARVKIDAPNRVPRIFLGDSLPFWRVLVAIAPTRVLDAERTAAPHGNWGFRASGAIPKDGQIHVWIQREDAVSGFGLRGRQPYFDSNAYEEQQFDAMGDVAVSKVATGVVRRNGTISGLATNSRLNSPKTEKDIVVVGGYRWRSDAAALYSSAGSSAIAAPVVMLPTDVSRVLAGIPASGSRSGTSVTLNGTSVAAPQVTRLLADELARLKPADYPTFHALAYLTGLFSQSSGTGRNPRKPPRPPKPEDELASQEYIRCERVTEGLLSSHGELEDRLAARVHKS